jgi:Carbohydrate esterase, sialic acid-specific acetylesterase
MTTTVAIWCGVSEEPAAFVHTATRPPVTLGLSGQSNALAVRPFLERVDRVVGYQVPSTPIACWGVRQSDLEGHHCWRQLFQTLTIPVDAFVWWQGEADAGTPEYYARLDSLIRRVRAASLNLQLPVAVVQLGPASTRVLGGPGFDAERWARTDAHAVYIPTHDLEFEADGTHMTSNGYAAAAGRIDQMIRTQLIQRRR